MSKNQNMQFQEFNYPAAGATDSTFLTGIRSTAASENVFITGVFKPLDSGTTQGLLYKGSIAANTGEWNLINVPNATSTSLYSVADIGNNLIRVVGSYKTTETQSLDLGCFYEGTISGNGKWLQLDPSSLVSNGDQVLNVIAHSVHGDIIVGNFDTKLISGRAFIYNITSKKFIEILYPNATSITAYGVWHNNDTSYTICGGFSDIGDSDVPKGIANGLIFDYDSKTEAFSAFTSYSYKNQPKRSIFYHFSGITKVGKNSYALSAWVIDPNGTGSGARTIARRKRNGTFGKSKFTRWDYPNALITTSNSVWNDWIIGVFNTESDKTIHGYVVKI
jgi:hypothetical protein